MKKLYLLFAVLSITLISYSQPAIDLMNSGTLKAQQGDFNGAIEDFTKSILIHHFMPLITAEQFQRNILKTLMGLLKI